MKRTFSSGKNGAQSKKLGFHLNLLFNPIALRKAKIVCNFGLSKCNRVNTSVVFQIRFFVSAAKCLPYLAIRSGFSRFKNDNK